MMMKKSSSFPARRRGCRLAFANGGVASSSSSSSSAVAATAAATIAVATIAVAVVAGAIPSASAASAASPSSSSLSSSGIHHLHRTTVRRKLTTTSPEDDAGVGGVGTATGGERALQAVGGNLFQEDPPSEEECPGTPYLWKIVRASTGNHAGFALGTMRLPFDVVVSSLARDSILAALEDVCDVYGELNLHDANVTSSLLQCFDRLANTTATLDSIPDVDLRDSYLDKLEDISRDLLSPNDTAVADLYASRLATLPLPEVQKLIMFANTPEYAPYVGTIYSGDEDDGMDYHILKLARPADDLEEVSAQCEILDSVYPSAEELINNFEIYSEDIRNSLNANLTKEIWMYRCGDIDKFASEVEAGLMPVEDNDFNDALLADRNVQMAGKMKDILEANPSERVMFAVGLSHWIVGDQSLEKLLEAEGYILEHVTEWTREGIDNPSNEDCGVYFDPELDLFLPFPEGVPGPAPGITSEPTHNVVLDTYFTAPPVVGAEGSTDLELVEEPSDEAVEGEAPPPPTPDGPAPAPPAEGDGTTGGSGPAPGAAESPTPDAPSSGTSAILVAKTVLVGIFVVINLWGRA